MGVEIMFDGDEQVITSYECQSCSYGKVDSQCKECGGSGEVRFTNGAHTLNWTYTSLTRVLNLLAVKRTQEEIYIGEMEVLEQIEVLKIIDQRRAYYYIEPDEHIIGFEKLLRAAVKANQPIHWY